MDVNEKIEARRNELGLSDVEVAKQVGLEIAWYGDVEAYPNEIYTTVELRKVKQLCEILKFDFFDLFEMKCVFCQENHLYLPDYSFPRHELICKKRIEHGLSQEELGHEVGFHVDAVRNFENDPDFLETWPIEYINNLADILRIPSQVLLNVKCRKCKR